MKLVAPHGDKLRSLLSNPKLPKEDLPRIEACKQRYDDWVNSLMSLPEGASAVEQAVELLNAYRLYLDLEVIFDSPQDFLYRQKGQLKLESSVIEEFLPYLVIKAFPDIQHVAQIGPQPCFLSLLFRSHSLDNSPRIAVRTKDQDFAIVRSVNLQASFQSGDQTQVETHFLNIGYACAECKTNLDKTMFQEALATARSLKSAVPSAKYLVLCEWLDMPPISTAGTDIDEVLILRKARRLDAAIRSGFSRYAQRQSQRKEYAEYLKNHPFSPDVFVRFLSHVRSVIQPPSEDVVSVLQRGYF